MFNNTEACGNLWTTEYRDLSDNFYLYDGGGGGGGATLLQLYDGSMYPIVIAPGGGGAGAIYNVTSFLSLLNITHNDSDDLEALYRNYTYGRAFEAFSENSDGTIGHQVFINSAGPGAGYFSSPFLPTPLDPDPLISDGFGGRDCSEAINIRNAESLPFSNTHGGFGGGGGGCDGGGGGGGYTGGSIITYGSTIPGEGGYSWPNPPWPLMGYNDGDGYVEIFLESCGCTYNCTIYNQSSFDCSCPSNTLLALNGFDCYREGCVIYCHECT